VPASYLYDLAEQLRIQAVAGVSLARTGHAVPARTFVAHGEPVSELCEEDQLTVHLDVRQPVASRPPSRATVPGHHGQSSGVQLVATLWVTLFRCVPGTEEDGSAPPAADLNTSARDLLVDAWALVTWLWARWAAKDLFTGMVAPAVSIGDVELLPPRGLTAGWRVPVTVQLSDPGP